MNRAQVLTVGLVTVLTITCIGLIVAVARSNSAGGSGQALAGVRVCVVMDRAAKNLKFWVFSLIEVFFVMKEARHRNH